MKEVSIDHDSALELNRMIYVLHKYFASLCEQTKADDLTPFRTSDQIHMDIKPQDFYNFEQGENSIRLHQVRSHYTLVYCGFHTSYFKPYRPSSDFKYQNYYGDFVTFDDARRAFIEAVDEQLRFQKLELAF